MRLIDADAFHEFIYNHMDFMKARNSDKVTQDEIHKFIHNQPTAYDVNKVVEELEENSVMRANSRNFYNNPQNGEYVDEVVLLSKAIEMVKAGGK